MKKKSARAIIVFLILSFIPMWLLSYLYYDTKKDAVLLVMMLLPAAASVLTRIITKDGFKLMMIKPNFKGNVKWYLAAYFATPFVACFGAVFFFLIYPESFSPLQSAFASEASISSISEFLRKLLILIPLAIIIDPMMGIVQCFGEELGWRGYLLQKFRNFFPPLSSAVITGVIWGLWHAPIIAMGYNYGSEHPVLGVLAMVLFCTVLGIIAGFLTYKVHSVWPAVLFHSALNGIDLWAPSALFMSEKPNVFLGPDVLGVIGGIGFIVVAAILMMVMRKWRTCEI